MSKENELYGFTCEVIYPSFIFLLERYENLPYERFAYNVFREALSALDQKILPAKLVVEFVSSSESCPGWAINCSVRAEECSNSIPNRIIVQSPELLPTLLLMFSVCIGRKLFSDKGRVSYVKDPGLLISNIQYFFDSGSALVRSYRSEGAASAIRTGYESLGIDMGTVEQSMDHFDTLSYLIANHEVAHIHVGQLSKRFSDSNEPSKAYEIIADLISTEWLFRRYVYLTPDTEGYRTNRHFGSHAEAVWANAKWAIESQLALLILMGASGAQNSGGRFHFDEGINHPGSFIRYWLQQAWLFSAIEGHFGNLLGDSRQDLTKIWEEYFGILCESGLISRRALRQVIDGQDDETISQVEMLVKTKKIEDLNPWIKKFVDWRKKSIESMKSKIIGNEDR